MDGYQINKTHKFNKKTDYILVWKQDNLFCFTSNEKNSIENKKLSEFSCYLMDAIYFVSHARNVSVAGKSIINDLTNKEEFVHWDKNKNIIKTQFDEDGTIEIHPKNNLSKKESLINKPNNIENKNVNQENEIEPGGTKNRKWPSYSKTAIIFFTIIVIGVTFFAKKKKNDNAQNHSEQ